MMYIREMNHKVHVHHRNYLRMYNLHRDELNQIIRK